MASGRRIIYHTISQASTFNVGSRFQARTPRIVAERKDGSWSFRLSVICYSPRVSSFTPSSSRFSTLHCFLRCSYYHYPCVAFLFVLFLFIVFGLSLYSRHWI
ncbi:hypothetical protein BJ508DRAFT_100761 [Ascobolus immersus RN42]|uniref:Uncharacterized protein n=1 Tax=Ascobolus immersus RN42 TaxID=1160509 RepID=A0A3N4ICX2_ASCIM|nr:hypothetical protein BJ508DRAFT_100761 [Ascobolus immersus RN42]